MLLQAWGTSMSLGVSADGRTAGLVAIELPWPLNIRSTDSSTSSSTTGAPTVRVAVNGVKTDTDETAGDGGSSSRGPTPADAAALNLLLRQQYKIEVPVACVSGILFTRISAQIYNSMADFTRLRDVICGLRQDAGVVTHHE